MFGLNFNDQSVLEPTRQFVGDAKYSDLIYPLIISLIQFMIKGTFEYKSKKIKNVGCEHFQYLCKNKTFKNT